MAISIILMLLGVGVILTAAHDLTEGAEASDDLRQVIAIAFFSIFIFGTLCVIKFRYAARLSSASLYKDGICSLIGTVLAVALFINTLIIDHAPNRWRLDPVVAILCGIGSLAYGSQAVVEASCVQGLPIFSCTWWMMSEGDGNQELNPVEDFQHVRKANNGEKGNVEMSSSLPSMV
jgi:hypothetical protein